MPSHPTDFFLKGVCVFLREVGVKHKRLLVEYSGDPQGKSVNHGLFLNTLKLNYKEIYFVSPVEYF